MALLSFGRVAVVATALVLAAACSEETRMLKAPGQSGPLAGVDPGAVGFVSPYSWEAGQETMPCRMHYDFAAPLDDVDCTFQAVDGTHEWKMVCPAHKELPAEDDFTFDGQGVLVAETTTDAPPPLGTGTRATYAMSSLSAPACTVVQMNEAGQPTRAHCVLQDFMLPDGTPVKGDRIVTRSYDDHGRFIFESGVETDTYVIDSEVSVKYDDETGRRDVENVFLPGHSVEIRDSRSDAYDPQLRLTERTIVRSGIQTVYTYDYDDMGRVITLSANFSSVDANNSSTPTSYVAQRSYDCH